MATENYKFPEFAGDESVDLLTVYNNAVTSIDTLLKAVADQANLNKEDIEKLKAGGAGGGGGGFEPSDTDKALSVDGLAAAKVDKSGIIYYKETTNQEVNNGQ